MNADFTCANGREIIFDLNKITNKEFYSLFDKKQPPKEEQAILFRMTGITEQEFLELTLADTKGLWQAFFDKVQRPLANPT